MYQLLQVQFLMTLQDVDNGKPKTADDAQKQVKDGPNNENDKQDKFEDDNSTKDVNAAGQHVNTAGLDVNIGSLKLNAVGPSVNTASSNKQDSPKDMFTMGARITPRILGQCMTLIKSLFIFLYCTRLFLIEIVKLNRVSKK
ncbi:hypothetical protein Tco_0306652 [Tanacetum coccineum]